MTESKTHAVSYRDKNFRKVVETETPYTLEECLEECSKRTIAGAKCCVPVRLDRDSDWDVDMS